MKMNTHSATGNCGERQARRLARATAATLILSGFVVLAGNEASAAPRSNAANNLEFKGVLVEPPPCSINNNSTLTVDFGNKVGVRKIATGIYRQPVELSLVCEESSLAWQLMLSVTGNPTDFDTDNATLAVSPQVDLAVKLLLDGQPLELNKPVKVNREALKGIEALLVQRADTILEEGSFSARATIRATYQ